MSECSMNTCDSCRWWGSDVSSEEEDHNKECEKATWFRPNDDDGFGIDSGINSRIVTGPKFGCIHHEPK